jgi:hypothetical protein
MLYLAAALYTYLTGYKSGYARYKKLYLIKIYRFDSYSRRDLIRR